MDEGGGGGGAGCDSKFPPPLFPTMLTSPGHTPNQKIGGQVNQGRIDPPKAGRGHATPIQPVQRAKCWRLLKIH